MGMDGHTGGANQPARAAKRLGGRETKLAWKILGAILKIQFKALCIQ